MQTSALSLSAADNLGAAAEHGRVCAIAATGQRDLMARAAAYPGLFPAAPFDATVFAAVSMATAFGAPWCTPEQLRLANRTALWVFAVDWLIDYRASVASDVDDVIRACQAVAHGASPAGDDEVGGFLAELVAELATSPAFASGRQRWSTELDRMLLAMRREWRWKTARRDDPAGDQPTFADYLDNADNFGSTFVNVSHWLRNADGPAIAHLDELTTVSREVQRVLRLVNDLATQGRDRGWGDLNAMMFTSDRAAIHAQINQLVDRCRVLLRPLEIRCPKEAAYLSRQIGFSSGFYRVADFWGRL
ncbi:terpene synthase family protein [Solwaraspora sp. WMMD406]|uniref:terpene synthase family protein n=1 Tax=Solwaraspora sp. WMMD406 TaxID=3016095 RepID=UPI002417DDD1|nr:terpene synthase family protein [Solwaraspora sp. WMMD406]MDG4766716.1 terpene synthase family protein [Solwaraspora sp. WMMD406]